MEPLPLHRTKIGRNNMIETRPIAKLKNYPLNVSVFGHLYDDPERKEQDDELVADIRAHGVRTPLVVTSSGIILSGHRRKEAAMRAGLHEVPVIVRDLPAEARDLEWWASNMYREKTREERARFWRLGKQLKKQYAKAFREEMEVHGVNVKKGKFMPVKPPEIEVGWTDRTASKADQVVDAIDQALVRKDSVTAKVLRRALNHKSVDAAYKLVKRKAKTPLTSIQAEKHKDATPRDVKGNAVPNKLRGVFEKRRTFASLNNRLHEILQDLEHLAAHPAGALIPVSQLKIEMKNLKDAFFPFAPYAVCPDCDGKGCDTCDQKGWLVRHQYRKKK